MGKDDGGYDSYGDDDFEDTVEDEVTAGKGYSSPVQKEKEQPKQQSYEEIEEEEGGDDAVVVHTVRTLPTVSSLTNTNTDMYYNNNTRSNATAVSDDYEENDYEDEEFETVESSRVASRQPSAKPNTTLNNASSTAATSAAYSSPIKNAYSAPVESVKPAMLSYEAEYEEEFEPEDEPSVVNNTQDYTAPPDLDLSELHPYAFTDTLNPDLNSVNSTLHSEYNGSLNGSPLLGLKLAASTDTLRGTSTDLYNTFTSTDALDNSLQYSVGSNVHMFSAEKADTGFYISQQNSIYDDYADTAVLNNNTVDVQADTTNVNNEDSYADDFDNDFEEPDGDSGIIFTNVDSTAASGGAVNFIEEPELAVLTTAPVNLNAKSDDSGDGLTNFLAINDKHTVQNKAIKLDVNSDPSTPNDSAYNSGTSSPHKHHRHHKHKRHHNDSPNNEKEDGANANSGTHSPHKHHHHKHKHHHKSKHHDRDYDSADNSGANSCGEGDYSEPSSPSKHKHRSHDKHHIDTSDSTIDGVGIADGNYSPSKSKHHAKHKDEHSDEAIADTVNSAVAKFTSALESIGTHTPTRETISDDEYSFTPPSHAKRIQKPPAQSYLASKSYVTAEPKIQKKEAPAIVADTSQPVDTTNVRKAKDSSFINTYDDDGLYGDYYFDDTALVDAKDKSINVAPATSATVSGSTNKASEHVLAPTPYSVRNFSIAITDSAAANSLANRLTNKSATANTESKKVDILARIQLNSMAYMEDDDSEFEEPEPLATSAGGKKDNASRCKVEDISAPTIVAAKLPSAYSNKTSSSLAPLPALSIKATSATYTSTINNAAPAIANNNPTDSDQDEFDHLFDTPAAPTTNLDEKIGSKAYSDVPATNADEDTYDNDAEHFNNNVEEDEYGYDEDHLEEDHSLADESTHSKHSKHSKNKKHKKSKNKHKHKKKNRVTMIGAPSEVDELNHSSSDSGGEDDQTEDTNTDSVFSSEYDHSPTTHLSISPLRGNNNIDEDFGGDFAFSPSKKHNLPAPSVDAAKEKKHKHKKHKSKRKHKKHKKSKNRSGGDTDTLESSLGTLDDLDEEGSEDDDSSASGDDQDGERENLGEEEFDF